jgi:hypothetical protein
MWLRLTRVKVHRPRWRPATRVRSASPALLPPRPAHPARGAHAAVHHGPLTSLAPVRVRCEPATALSTGAFERPLAFRAAFRRSPEPAFLAAGTPERDVVSLLAAPSTEQADQASARLAQVEWTDPAQGVLAALRGMALGQVAVEPLWGHSRAADALRLRHVRAAGEGTASPELSLRWGLFFRWAGERLALAAAGTLPPALLRVEAASLAAAHGYRRAFEALCAVEPARAEAERFDVLSSLALRVAFEDGFAPGLVAWLVPSGRLRRRGQGAREPWAAALASLRAFAEQGNVTALVHLSAALVAADLRERVLTFLGRPAASVLRRRWWSALPEGAQPGLADAVAVIRAHASTLTRGEQRPWPKGWGGPDLRWVVSAVDGLLGPRVHSLGAELFLDDRLAVAAIFGAIGYLPSAVAQLGAVEPAPALADARRALREALSRPRGAADQAAVLLSCGEWDRDADRLYGQLRGTPDPSVALGSPHWLLAETRGALMAQLVKEGRRSTASAVRAVLERPDLRTELAPFWLLRGTEDDTTAVRALAVRLAGATQEAVPEREWVRFVEDVCRRHAGRAEGAASGGSA